MFVTLLTPEDLHPIVRLQLRAFYCMGRSALTPCIVTGIFWLLLMVRVESSDLMYASDSKPVKVNVCASVHALGRLSKSYALRIRGYSAEALGT